MASPTGIIGQVLDALDTRLRQVSRELDVEIYKVRETAVEFHDPVHGGDEVEVIIDFYISKQGRREAGGA